MTYEVAEPVRKTLVSHRQEVDHHSGDLEHDRFARVAINTAIAAGLAGNAAVGALLINQTGEVINSAQNQMFEPRFRSDLHAEMVLLNEFEDLNQPDPDLRGYTLLSSLEPCEMCTIRIINSGVTNVVYVAADRGKGGLSGPNKLAPHWSRLAASQHFSIAECDGRLAEISLAVFEATIGDVSRRLMERRSVSGST